MPFFMRYEKWNQGFDVTIPLEHYNDTFPPHFVYKVPGEAQPTNKTDINNLNKIVHPYVLY